MLPPPVESQGLLTTKAPLWVTSSLLPILAATSLNPPSLLVTNKRQQAGCEGGKPIYLGSAASKRLLACALWQLYWLYSSAGKEEDGSAAVYCSAQKSWSCFWCLALPMPSWSNLLSAFWILAIANAPYKAKAPPRGFQSSLYLFSIRFSFDCIKLLQ